MNKKIDLYELLPSLYRLRDAEQGYPLRALLDIISEQANLLKEDVDCLWDELFIETAADWVIPYIGDLVGVNPLHEVNRARRVDVAKTIYYRRRKGTLPMLEELARDVTGWGAHAVAFFELLGWTQNLNHLRYQMTPNPDKTNPNAVDRVGTVNLRNRDNVDKLDRPFDTISHTVDVRQIERTKGWYNIRKVGFFLWRLGSYRLTDVTPRQSSAVTYGYHFSPLGNPAPLFTNAGRETDETELATEIHVPGPIRPFAFYLDLENYRRDFAKGKTPRSNYYGDGGDFSVCIKRDGVPVPAKNIVAMSLGTWVPPPPQPPPRPPQQLTYPDVTGNNVSIPIVAGLDVCRGRIAFAAGQEPTQSVEVDFHYGFSMDIGGGSYDHRRGLAEADEDTIKFRVGKHGEADYRSLADALNHLPANRNRTIITITDSATYVEQFNINLLHAETLVIQANDGKRPTLRIVDVNNNVTALRIAGTDSADATLILNGLLIEGAISVEANSLGRLQIAHCTLVPGRELGEDGKPVKPDEPSLFVADSNDSLEVEIDHSIVGALHLPTEMTGLNVQDSIIDAVAANVPAAIRNNANANAYGPPTTLVRTTIFGTVRVKELTLASEVIFTNTVITQRRQAGCVRFSHVLKDSQTPRRYRCQPDLVLEEATGPGEVLTTTEEARIRARLTPSFTSLHYGDPAYAQLNLNCAEEITTGAENGAEMGAFNQLMQPQRAANLRIRLEEYLPFGLEPGLIYVT